MLTIKYVNGDTVAFQLGSELWYLRMGPGIPSLYDERLKKQIVPNIDIWFQSKTGHRYSYQTVCDMATAFAMATKCSYKAEDIIKICFHACRLAVAEIFHSELVDDYRKTYWLELLDPSKLPVQASSIRDDFQNLRIKLGDDTFYNYLCRLWKICQLQNPSEAAVFERLINRMGKKPLDPKYPNTNELDAKLGQQVVGRLLRRNMPQFPGIPEDIIENADTIQAEHD